MDFDQLHQDIIEAERQFRTSLTTISRLIRTSTDYPAYLGDHNKDSLSRIKRTMENWSIKDGKWKS